MSIKKRAVNTKKFNISTNKKNIILIVIISIFLFISMWGFYTGLTDDKTKTADIKLQDLAHSNINAANAFFNNQITALKAIAIIIEGYDNPISKESIENLKIIAKELNYQRLAIDTFDGNSYTSDGKVIDVSSKNYVGRIKKGELFITNVEESIIEKEHIIAIFVPIHDKDGAPIASLRCVVNTNVLHKEFAINFVEDTGYFYIIDDNGNYVAKSGSKNALLMGDNFFDSIKLLDYRDNNSSEKIVQDMGSQKSGYSEYSYENNKRFAYYTPVGINNWSLITISPTNTINAMVNKNMSMVIIFLIEVVLLVIIMFSYFYIAQRKIKTKALLEEKCFRVLSEQSGNIILEWDFSLGRIKSLSNFEKIFGRELITKNNQYDAINSDLIHPDDVRNFSSVFHKINDGMNVYDERFRVKDVKGNYIWCSIDGVVINDFHGKPYKAIGSMKNIDKEENERKKLKEKAEKDLLTDLYNKISTENFINEYLKSETKNKVETMGALFIIDLDNFKTINDNLGHQFGDTVIVDVANKLKKIFRTSDIIGRIGGDEFLVFMKSVIDTDVIKDRANEVCKSFNRVIPGEINDYIISASIGISIFYNKNETFESLFDKSDKALYATKRMNKNSYTIYSDSIKLIDTSETTVDNAKRYISSNYVNDYIHSIFEMLYETKDITTTINIILAMLGKKYNLDRCYVYEWDETHTFLQTKFEWYNENINNNIEIMTKEQFDSYFANTINYGMFFCNDVNNLDEYSKKFLKNQGIKSMLHCAIYDKGVLKGFIGYDDFKSNRAWSGEDIAKLGYISKIVSIFILNKQDTPRENNKYTANDEQETK